MPRPVVSGRCGFMDSVILCPVWFPGFHAIDLDNGVLQDLYLPAQGVRTTVTPHAIIPIPRTTGELLLCYNSQSVHLVE